MEYPKTHQLHSDLAVGLHNLMEQRNTETEIDRLERELGDPDTSFLGGLKDALSKVKWHDDKATYCFSGSESTFNFIEMISSRVGYSAYNSKWSDELFDDTNTLRDMDRDRDFYLYAALSSTRKYLKSDEPKEQIYGLLIAAYIASLNLPEDYAGQKPKRHKGETVEEILFRKAITVIRETTNNHTQESQLFGRFTKTLSGMPVDESTKDGYFYKELYRSDANNLRKGAFDTRITNFANTILELLAREQTTPESIDEEYFKAVRLQILLRGEAQEEQDPVTLNWDILPPEALGEIENTGKIDSREGNPDFVDPERLKWLARLAIDWGNGAYIVVSSLNEKSNSNKYYAAILPGLVSGVPVEHAVAENASSGNATYVFRGERGLNTDGSTWLTWRDVLSDTKSGARALGAKKILHGQYWDENVLEYLTRPDSDLEHDRYKR